MPTFLETQYVLYISMQHNYFETEKLHKWGVYSVKVKTNTPTVIDIYTYYK
jgi:hypothetical protein